MKTLIALSLLTMTSLATASVATSSIETERMQRFIDEKDSPAVCYLFKKDKIAEKMPCKVSIATPKSQLIGTISTYKKNYTIKTNYPTPKGVYYRDSFYKRLSKTNDDTVIMCFKDKSEDICYKF